jgi:hypothetical protein
MVSNSCRALSHISDFSVISAKLGPPYVSTSSMAYILRSVLGILYNLPVVISYLAFLSLTTISPLITSILALWICWVGAMTGLNISYVPSKYLNLKIVQFSLPTIGTQSVVD